MREIKFRAWVKAINKNYMAVQGEPDLETLGSFMHHYVDEPLLMQYAGLKDSNGTEIYEGDIGKNAFDDFYEVKFDDGKFIAILDGNVVIDLSEVADDIEVIGNIYETPELLK